ncbi:hypothetical protein ACB371_04740 [Klebsiella pneumoniae]
MLSLQRKKGTPSQNGEIVEALWNLPQLARFIQQAFSPGYDTFAAIMLISRRPGRIRIPLLAGGK